MGRNTPDRPNEPSSQDRSTSRPWSRDVPLDADPGPEHAAAPTSSDGRIVSWRAGLSASWPCQQVRRAPRDPSCSEPLSSGECGGCVTPVWSEDEPSLSCEPWKYAQPCCSKHLHLHRQHRPPAPSWLGLSAASLH